MVGSDKMASSAALKQFKESLQMAEELIKIEIKNYKDPPPPKQQKAVEGLRGGAAVLIVAAWENFLKQLVEEKLTYLTIQPKKVSFGKLPIRMQTHCVFQTLESAMKGPRFQKSNKIDRIPNIERACNRVISRTVNPEAFSETRSNPNPETVKEMFQNIGINNMFRDIKANFEMKWKQSVPDTFIEDKLIEILNRRHAVAHEADALKISREDLKDYVKFMKIVAPLFEKHLRQHIKYLMKK